MKSAAAKNTCIAIISNFMLLAVLCYTLCTSNEIFEYWTKIRM